MSGRQEDVICGLKSKFSYPEYQSLQNTVECEFKVMEMYALFSIHIREQVPEVYAISFSPQ